MLCAYEYCIDTYNDWKIITDTLNRRKKMATLSLSNFYNRNKVHDAHKTKRNDNEMLLYETTYTGYITILKS